MMDDENQTASAYEALTQPQRLQYDAMLELLREYDDPDIKAEFETEFNRQLAAQGLPSIEQYRNMSKKI